MITQRIKILPVKIKTRFFYQGFLMSRIHLCSKTGDIDGVVAELSAGVSVDALCAGMVQLRMLNPEDLVTPLMTAVASLEAGINMVSLLLDRGADVNVKTVGQVSALSLAVARGDVEMIRVLIDAGADFHGEQSLLVYAVLGLNESGGRNAALVVRFLLERGVSINNRDGYNALNWASYNGFFDVVQILLDAGIDPGVLRWTSLMSAVVFGSFYQIQELIRGGADLHVQDAHGRTPWLLSLQAGEIEKATWLIDAGSDGAARGCNGRGPVAHAVMNGRVEALQWLMERGFDLEEMDDFQVTPLMIAVERGFLACVKILLNAGVDIHRVDHAGEKAITKTDNLDIARILVEAGNDWKDLNAEARALFTRTRNFGVLITTREAYESGKRRRFGTANPELMAIDFWLDMIHCGVSAWVAKQRFGDQESDDPVWCFQRYGTSITLLPDGRIIEIGGEHEDYYDTDFCVYNDVIVHDIGGKVSIYGYPEDVFPPTDFHSATVIDDHMIIIGSVGYQDRREYGLTPVYRLNLRSFQVETIVTTGENPGWIHGHRARREGDRIRIDGGTVLSRVEGKEIATENTKEYSLDLVEGKWVCHD
jgi:ankyrin repeat protein